MTAGSGDAAETRRISGITDILSETAPRLTLRHKDHEAHEDHETDDLDVVIFVSFGLLVPAREPSARLTCSN